VKRQADPQADELRIQGASNTDHSNPYGIHPRETINFPQLPSPCDAQYEAEILYQNIQIFSHPLHAPRIGRPEWIGPFGCRKSAYTKDKLTVQHYTRRAGVAPYKTWKAGRGAYQMMLERAERRDVPKLEGNNMPPSSKESKRRVGEQITRFSATFQSFQERLYLQWLRAHPCEFMVLMMRPYLRSYVILAIDYRCDNDRFPVSTVLLCKHHQLLIFDWKSPKVESL
jgi:hypothetical protein